MQEIKQEKVAKFTRNPDAQDTSSEEENPNHVAPL